MIAATAILLATCWVQESDDVAVVHKEAGRRFAAYHEHGQPDEERRALVQFLLDRERRFETTTDYLLAESRYLRLLGDLTASQAAFRRIPDESLVEPRDLLARVDDLFARDPASAVPASLRLISGRTPGALQLFAEWLHHAIALEFAPMARVDARFDSTLRFLDTIARKDPAGGQIVSGVRMWVTAQQTADPSALRALFEISFPDPLAYGPRYQLLLYEFVELKFSHDDVSRLARQRRHDLVESLRPIAVNGPYEPGRERQRLRYWVSFGRYREAESLRRQRAPMFWVPLADAAPFSTITGATPVGPMWEEEMRALGGAREYVTALADHVEKNGRPDLAIHYRADAARADVSALPALAALFATLHPGESFDAFWREERFKHAARLPAGVLPYPGAQNSGVPARGWRIVKVWSTSCAECLQEAPAIARLVQEFDGRVVTVDPEDDPEGLRAYLRIHVPDLSVKSAAGDSLQRLDVGTLPATIVVTPDGRYVVIEESSWESESRYWLSQP
jgi:thiol-disulfide isomerase/thioredoxin